jgi:cupin superfamily acireductone dioxygenase involved in methionine salvage
MSTARDPDKKLSEHRLISLTIRFDPETYEKLIAIAGDKSKAEYIRAVLIAHLSAPQEHRKSTEGAPLEMLQAKNESLEELIRAKDANIKDLQNQIGFLTQDHVRISGQLDRLLMPSKEEQKEKGKKWFEFWK